MASAGDGDTTSHPNKTDQAVSFEICFDRDNKRPRSAPPKRLSTHKKKAITKEEIDKKQQEAEERRKENEREMIDRIAQKREECRKLNENFQALLAQDAKLHDNRRPISAERRTGAQVSGCQKGLLQNRHCHQQNCFTSNSACLFIKAITFQKVWGCGDAKWM